MARSISTKPFCPCLSARICVRLYGPSSISPPDKRNLLPAMAADSKESRPDVHSRKGFSQFYLSDRFGATLRVLSPLACLYPIPK